MKRNWNDYWSRYSPMDFKKIGFFVAVVVLVVLVAVISSNYKPTGQEIVQTPETIPDSVGEVETPIPADKGNLLVAVKDVKQKLSQTGLGEATELFITISSIQVHSKNDTLENRSVVASGWTTIFEGDKSFDLLQFIDNIALIAEKEVEPGSYTQIRLYVSNAQVKIDNPLFGVVNKTYPMYIPSNALKVVRPFTVEANKTTVLTIDFDVPRMVTRTSQGYTFGPVLKGITDEVTVKEQMIEKGKKPENAVEV